MKILKTAMLVVLLAVSAASQAQRRYSNEEIMAAISRCLLENAPEGWQSVIFTLKPAPAAAGEHKPATVEHKVIVGAADSAPKNLKPCRPDYVPKAVNTFRENQEGKARDWTGITITVQRDGRYSLAFHYPE